VTRIAHIILPNASEYERKSQRIDQAALSGPHEVVVVPVAEVARSGAQVAHVYASEELPPGAFLRFPLPYVASADLPASRWRVRRPVAPRFVVSPLAAENDPRFRSLPESVEERYFAAAATREEPVSGEVRTVASFARPSTRIFVEQTVARIERFRSDVRWQLFSHIPSPEDLAGVDLWVDPAVRNDDFDGCAAEALVVGLQVVTSRTPINVQRLEQGRTGTLVPPGDPNEMTHAILATLFKREVAESKRSAARQTVSKFRARLRLRRLTELYEALNS
jgi:hypothetical protein